MIYPSTEEIIEVNSKAISVNSNEHKNSSRQSVFLEQVDYIIKKHKGFLEQIGKL